jgi:glycosyltransferase involved in cell wall biosynthesis
MPSPVEHCYDQLAPNFHLIFEDWDISIRRQAAAIGPLLARWRAALPEAEVVVFDNNSTDGTGALARQHGARVVMVAERGQGHVVRAIFEQLRDRELVVLTDGDGTYPPEVVGTLLEPVRAGLAEMTVGARRPLAGAGAMSPVRGLGNLLIRSAFAVLIGPGPGDLLSGYRVFSARFLREVRPRSRGFEIEAELAALAVARGDRVVEVPVAYHPRAAGTASKLHALRDGLRITSMIVAQGLRLRPWRGLGLLAALLVALAWALAWR